MTALAVHDGKLIATTWLDGIWESDGTTWTKQFSNLNPSTYATSLIEDDAGSVITGSVSAYKQGTAQLLGSDVLVSAGGDWAPLQSWSGSMHGLQTDATALTRYRDEIVAAGSDFVADNGQWKRVDGLARWDGTRWRPFPGWPAAFRAGVFGIAASGDTLVLTGSFDGVPAVLFDGTQWVPLDTMNAQFFSPVWYRGSLYAGSYPGTAASNKRGGVYRLDGTHWTEIAEITSPTYFPWVQALAVHDGRLIAGGAFDSINGVTAQSVAAWDGTSWSALDVLNPGAGTDLPRVWSLVSVDGTLYAGGSFSGPNYEDVAQWDGSTWTPIGPRYNLARTMTSYDGKLHVAFDVGYGSEVRSWDGSNWSTFATFNSLVLTMFPDGTDFWAGGDFSLVDGVQSAHVALWHKAVPSSPPSVALSPGSPNPMRNSVAFTYSLPKAGEILLTVSDARGRHVATLDSGMRQPGDHTAQWDGKDASGHRAPAGMYFVRLAGAVEANRKIVLLP